MGVASPAWAEVIHVGVNGMVCAFCVKGLEKGLKKQDAVRDVDVDLDNKQVTVTTKDGQTLDDATLQAAIADAGFSTTSIKREN